MGGSKSIDLMSSSSSNQKTIFEQEIIYLDPPKLIYIIECIYCLLLVAP